MVWPIPASRQGKPLQPHKNIMTTPIQTLTCPQCIARFPETDCHTYRPPYPDVGATVICPQCGEKFPHPGKPPASFALTPWRVGEDPGGNAAVWTRHDPAAGSRNNWMIAEGIQDEREALRIVNCVNACAHISDWDLTCGGARVVSQLFLREVQQQADRQQQRIGELKRALYNLMHASLRYGGAHPQHDAHTAALSEARATLAL